MKNDPKVIVALDFSTEAQVFELLEKITPDQCRVKVGKELFTLFGPRIVESIQERGFDVFLDLKFHDIPQTVAKACSAAASLGVWMTNVHALGGEKMMSFAREALQNIANRPKLIAVTVLTSMDQAAIEGIGIKGNLADFGVKLAKQVSQAGLDGVVASAQEVGLIKSATSASFLTVTPGIRPENYGVSDDQSRIMTPRDAVAAGSDYLVVGRPITQADSPSTVLAQINQSIGI